MEEGDGTFEVNSNLGTKIKRFFMWLFIFPIIFERLEFIRSWIEKLTKTQEDIFKNMHNLILNTDKIVKDGDAFLHALCKIIEQDHDEFSKIFEKIGYVSNEAKQQNQKNLDEILTRLGTLLSQNINIEKTLESVNNTPHHNATFYRKLDGKVINLNTIKSFDFEVEYEPKTGDNGTIAFALMGDNKKIDEFRIDLTKFDENHEKKPVFDLGRLLLKKRKLDRLIIAEIAKNNLYIFITSLSYLQHSQLFNSCVHSYIQAITPFWEKDQQIFSPGDEVSAKIDNEQKQIMVVSGYKPGLIATCTWQDEEKHPYQAEFKQDDLALVSPIGKIHHMDGADEKGLRLVPGASEGQLVN